MGQGAAAPHPAQPRAAGSALHSNFCEEKGRIWLFPCGITGACSKRGVLSDEKEGFPKEALACVLVLFKLPLSVIFCPDLKG